MSMKISIIGPAHRIELWPGFIKNIVSNHEIDIVFVTDVEPNEEQKFFIEKTVSKQNNVSFKYIFSKVKPAQCFEIAYRESIGDFMIWTGDDFIYSPYAIDNVMAMYTSLHDCRAMISFRVVEDGSEVTHMHKPPWDNSVQLTTTALISKKAIEKVGGLADIRFVAGIWDVDLMMRIYAIGGKVYVCQNAFAYEPHNLLHKQEHNFAFDWNMEMEMITKLWCINGKTTFTRQDVFTGYSSTDILTKNQGNLGSTGKWI